MALTKEDREWVRLIAEKAAYAVAESVIEKVMIAHIAGCPHGQNLGRFRAWLIGVAVGCSIAGGLGGFGLAKFLEIVA